MISWFPLGRGKSEQSKAERALKSDRMPVVGNHVSLSESETVRSLIELHSHAVENQRHFNQLCLNLRLQAISLAVLYVGAITAMVSVSTQVAVSSITIFGCKINYSPLGLGIVPLIIFWWAIRRLDIYSYHNFLRGATQAVEQYEINLINYSTSFYGLSMAISKASQGEGGRGNSGDNGPKGKDLENSRKNKKKTPASTKRIKMFYRWGMAGIVIFGLMVTFGIPIAM